MFRLAAAMACIGVLAAPAAALQVCRPNVLGTVSCLGPPAPPALPPFFGPPRLVPRPGAALAPPVFVPASRSNSFGETLLTDPDPGDAAPPRRCVADSLGNLRCQ